MNGIEMANTIQNMCHTWQINRGFSDDGVTGAFVLYDFMKARGEDVSITPAVVIGLESGKSGLIANIIVYVKSDIGKVDLVDACEYSSNLEVKHYFTTMIELKAWMDGKEDGDVMLQEKQKEVVAEYMGMMKLSLLGRAKGGFRTEKYKEMKAYVEDEYKKYVMGFIKTAITAKGVKLPFTPYIMGVPIEGVLIPYSLSKNNVTVYFRCPLISGGFDAQTMFYIGANADEPRQDRQLSMCEMFKCLERIMAIFRTVKYDKLHGFSGLHIYIPSPSSNPPNIDDICCVCRDPCFVKTKCSHTLCLQCWGSIISTKYPNGRVNIEGGHINCPMCRQSLELCVKVVKDDVDVDKLD